MKNGVFSVGLAVGLACVTIAGIDGRGMAGIEPSSTRVEGLHAPLKIARDRDGVPHIRGASERDAYFGLGYAHAQDRLWQMEYQRRLGSGRLAEILGADYVASDRFFRTIGTRRAAESAWEQAPSDMREALEAYAAGVNAYVGSLKPHQLPVEFVLYGLSPEPWRPEDSLVWMKTLAWAVGRNWDYELMRVRLTQRLGAARATELMPLHMAKDPQILAEGDHVTAKLRRPATPPQTSTLAIVVDAARAIPGAQIDALVTLHQTLRDRLGLGGIEVGSNNWVIAGARTTSGKPILANDPHLDSQVPGNWYLAHVTGGALDAIGATFPGLPFVAIGHNGRIAWGITNTGTDVQDLYVEQIVNGQVVTPNGPVPLRVVAETIKVRGQADVAMPVRITPHGPLISDVVAPGGVPLALRWAGLDAQDESVGALLRMNSARTWEEFRTALRSAHVPMQNFAYADAEGNIGYLAPGALPRRAKGDGFAPVPGWTGEFEWTDYVPFDELPSAFNPPRGFIVTANNRVSSSYPYYVGNFAPYYRAARIVERIGAKARHSADDVAAMQADVTSLHAREVLPRLLQVDAMDERSSKALAMLQGWDGTLDGRSAQAAIFEAWLRPVGAALFADELGDLWPLYRRLAYMSDIATAVTIADPDSPWCDDQTTGEIETCNARLGTALAEGLATMAAAQGTDDLHRWRWDRVHDAVFPHHPFDDYDLLRPFFNRRIPNGGDQFTVNVGAINDEDYEQDHVNDYRQVVDFGAIGESRFIVAPGQSGNVFSKHYDDMLRRWQRVEYVRMRFMPRRDEPMTEFNLSPIP